jgi:sirohydrochlorin cobaltochelatase
MASEKTRLIVLYSHGSKDPQWKIEMETLAAQAKALSSNVLTAYMELCDPSLEDIIIEKGVENIASISVLPVFLATGKHLKSDIPELVESLRQKYGIAIDILPPAGHHPLLADAIATITKEYIPADSN